MAGVRTIYSPSARAVPLFVSALAVLSLVASCVAPPRASAPVAAPPARVVVPLAAAPAVLPSDWRDWPQTPGDWRYERTSFGSQASFGNGSAGVFRIECGSDRRVRLERPGATGGALTIRTSSTARMLPAIADGDPPQGASASLSALDPLLDAIGFSRGRFVVEQAGAPPLVLPAWAEVERVVEDCRG